MIKKKKKKRPKQGRSLAEKLYNRKIKKALKQGGNLFLCEAHAHHPNACGIQFVSKHGWVECPGCGNQYCRWVSYKEPEQPFVP